jgi:hypothetical protein
LTRPALAVPSAPWTADRRRIEEVEAMMALSRPERWALLVDREPRLLEVENEVRGGAFGGLRSDDQSRGVKTGKSRIGPDGRAMYAGRSVDGPDTQAEIHAVNVAANSRTMLHKRIAVLLGPDSGQRDLLLGSTRAHQAAEGYLLHTQG